MLIVLTTPLPALIHLSRRLRLPEPLIELAFLIYRFTGLTIGLAATGRQAQRNRLGDRDLASWLRATGMLAASLLPRTLVRAQRLQVGLVARGYDGRMQTLAPAWRLSPRFAAASSVLAAAIALAAWGSRGLSP